MKERQESRITPRFFGLSTKGWNCHFFKDRKESGRGGEDLKIDVLGLRCLLDIQMEMLSR